CNGRAAASAGRSRWRSAGAAAGTGTGGVSAETTSDGRLDPGVTRQSNNLAPAQVGARIGKLCCRQGTIMGLDDALIFTRVVECHSFTQAAQLLGMQKSTVSRRIAQLEERLGVRLLNRTTRKLRLTEVGQAYYERCRQIMLDFAEAEQAVMQLQQVPSGLLKLTAPIEFGQLLLGRVVGEFMRLHPQVMVEAELGSRLVDPVEEGVDIVIRIGQPQDSTLVARKLLEMSRHLYASPAYLAAHGQPTSEEELV